MRLGDSRDALGLRRIRLDWNVTPADRQGIEHALQVFAAALGQSLRGRVRVRIGLGYDWSRLPISHHSIGTPRMHADPKRGVVAANGRVHGLAKLYVGGSSVFSTAEHANPTFTIVALTLRLAERQAAARLGEVLRRARPELADREDTLRQLFAPVRWRDVQTADATARLREQVRDDLAHGRTLSVQGWLLAASEARLYALLAPPSPASPL